VVVGPDMKKRELPEKYAAAMRKMQGLGVRG